MGSVNVRVALIHDWLTGMRGGEKVLEGFCDLYPEADLFTLLHLPGRVSEKIESHTIYTSFVQHLPGARSNHRYYLPLFPTAIEQFDLGPYDLVLSSSHCVAKGVIPSPSAFHMSYVHSPMRYIWDMYPEYFGGDQNIIKRLCVPPIANYLRTWDASSSNRVDSFVANSQLVSNRIEKYYRRRSTVIHPPVDCSFFDLADSQGDYFLIVSALVPYKRVDMAIRAFNRVGLPLKVVGSGEMQAQLEDLAGPTVEILGWQSDSAVRDLYKRCRAFVFPQKEDFGIAPLEAQSCGKPVIAYRAGGALETVIGTSDSAERESGSSPTGVFFDEQSVDSLQDALERFENVESSFDATAIRAHALGFDTHLFRSKIESHVETHLQSV